MVFTSFKEYEMKRVSKAVLSVLAACSVSTTFASPWPVGINDEATAVYRQATVIPVIPNDIGENLYIAEVNTTSLRLGSVRINEDKLSVTYTSANATEDEFWYVLKDDQGRTNAAKVTVSISDNNWPAANTDTAEATYNEVITIPVLDNDTGTELTLSSVNEWSSDQGKVWIEDNQVKYQQVGEKRGDITDEFWYVFEDKWGRKNAAKVTISLNDEPTTAWPTAVADAAEAKKGTNVLIPVLANDEGEGLTLTKTNAWSQNGGKTQIVEDLIRYTPPQNFTGTDVFWYDFEDKFGRKNSTQVTVDVAPNTALSVVEFCGTNYETDGTSENTVLTSLSPTPYVAPYQLLDITEVSGETGAEIAGRRYYVEGDEETGFSVWTEFDGAVSKVVDAPVGKPVYLVGAYNQSMYFAQGFNLFAHNGDELTDLGYLFDDIIDSSNENEEYSINSNTEGGVLRVTAVSNNSVERVIKTNQWRVADGLDLQMVPMHRALTETSVDAWLPNVFVTRVYDYKYFNGLDYRFQYRYDWSAETGDVNENSFAINDREEVVGKLVGSSTGDMVENNNRLFVSIVNNENESSTLYAIDNFNNNLIEIANCSTPN